MCSSDLMPMGHVAVVTQVLGPREIAIDHSNWPVGGRRGAVSRGTSVVDVSERNDWSAVRVELGSGDYGSVYPANGFIYNRPDTGAFKVKSGPAAPMMALNNAPRDLRGAYDRYQSARGTVEYAEQPAARIAPVSPPVARIDYSISGNVFNGGN